MNKEIKERILFFSSLAGYLLFVLSFGVEYKIDVNSEIFLMFQLALLSVGIVCAGILNFTALLGDEEERAIMRKLYKNAMKRKKQE